MFSLQEITEKFHAQLKQVRDQMDTGATFHPEDASIYTGLGLADEHGVRETLRSVSLSQLIRKLKRKKLKEALSRDTTLGDYLVADKVHDDLILAANQTDLAPLISAQVVDGWEGADLIVNVVDDAHYKPDYSTSTAVAPSQTASATKCTLKPQTFTLNMPIGMDLEEDTGYALVDWHVRNAGKAIGHLSTEMVLNVLKAGADGVGTANTEAGGADTTTWLDVQNAYEANGRDKFKSNTMVLTTETWTDTLLTGSEIAGGAAGDYGTMPHRNFGGPAAGFDMKFEMLDAVFCESDALHDAADAPGAAMTACVTLVFDRDWSVLTGRKRWMQLENYADPVKDLAGAVISCRQDSVTLYKDACCTITEV